MLELRSQTGAACDLGGFNCDAVLASRYSKLLGVPLAYWGLAYYLTLFFLAVVYLDFKHKIIFRMIEMAIFSGFFVSLILFYIQAFILKAFCIYCLISEVAVFAMVLGYLAMKLLPKESD